MRRIGDWKDRNGRDSSVREQERWWSGSYEKRERGCALWRGEG